MPFESGTFPAQTSASRVCPGRQRELLGWSNGPAGNCAPPSTPVTASAIPWLIWHTYWSSVERWHIFGAGHSRTLRHDWHGVRLCNDTRCRRMFSPWPLIFGSLTTFFMCLGTFILQPDVHTFSERLLGPSWFAIFHEFMAYLKEQIAIAALTIRKETQIMGLSCDLVQ